jgi:hypothetical protein
MSTFSAAFSLPTVLNSRIKIVGVTNSALHPKMKVDSALYDAYCVYSQADTTGSVAPKNYKSVAELPYNTGKVAIGRAYLPTQRGALSRDEELLQAALLNGQDKRQQDPKRFTDLIIYALGLAALVVIWFTV